MSRASSDNTKLDTAVTGVGLGDLSQPHKRHGNPSCAPDNADSTKYVHIFTCFDKRLFHTGIMVKNDHIDDDKKMFEKLNTCYWRARGPLGRMSLVHSLTGLRVVKVWH